MALITKPYTFSAGATIVAAEHNGNFDTIYSDHNGGINNANIANSAGISYSKLNLSGSIQNSDLANNSVFTSGMIMMWSGSIGSIPSGWLLCNGAGGTPDLRDRFVIGAGNTYAVNATGGASTSNALIAHTHTGTTYGISGSTKNKIGLGLAEDSNQGSYETGSAGSGSSFSILNPYYALAFIMKT